MRLLIGLLLLAPFASAQTVGELVDRAMRGVTGPEERRDTMQELLKREGGPDALAKAGLDPMRDPEVVHMTVQVLLKSGNGGPHMAAICRLLLNDKHREKVKERVYRHAEEVADPRKLVLALSMLARGSDEAARDDVELQRAAVKALGVIPHRDAVEAIASVWNDAKDRGIIAECELQLRGVVIAETGKQALEYLRERHYKTWADLIREVSTLQETDAKRWKKLAERFAEGHFKQATHAEVFRAFHKGEPIEKLAAAKRARVLAESKDYGKGIGASKFAIELVTCLLKEMKSGRTDAAQDLVGALVAMNRNQAFGDARQPMAAELRDALVAGADGGPGTAEFAAGAMELLSGMGADAMPVLAEYAARHATTAVRTAAVEALGDIASRGDPATKARVGQLLAELLAAKPPSEVRSRLIFSLRAAPSPEAIATIGKLLTTKNPKRALAREDVAYAMELLAVAPFDDADALLAKLVRESEDEQIRIAAIEYGLVKRLRTGREQGKVLDVLSGIVLDPKQPKKVRESVLTALGSRGSLVAAKLLGELAGSETLEPELRQAASQQRVTLAERQLKSNGDGQVTKEDLEAIARVIDEESRNGADVDRMVRLAKGAVEKAARLKIPGGMLRTRYAERLEAKKGLGEAELRTAWKDAAENSEKDGLAENERIFAWNRYRQLAKGAERVDIDLALLKLAVADNRATRFKHWLDALEGAVQEKNRALADRVISRRPAGEFPGDAAARRDRLLGLYEKLP